MAEAANQNSVSLEGGVVEFSPDGEDGNATLYLRLEGGERIYEFKAGR